jgi:hypothetical protein
MNSTCDALFEWAYHGVATYTLRVLSSDQRSRLRQAHEIIL